MSAGVLWALVAAVGFGLTQVSSRKANQRLDAYRAAFGLLLVAEILLLGRAVLAGELGVLLSVPAGALGLFALAAALHFMGGWSLLGLSQQAIGVARTGALVSASPLVGTILAAVVLSEPLTPLILVGVVLSMAGVALISLSGGTDDGTGWARPWLALMVAVIWGTSPLIIRLGLERYDHPVLGLTIGLGLALVLFAVALAVRGDFSQPSRGGALRWMVMGGAAGAVAISAQWISWSLTTIAVAITVQQLTPVVVAGLVPVLFDEPFERLNARFLAGTAAMMVGSVIVVLVSR